ncbi:MAG: ATP-binding protein, partial [Rhodospirillales bacterium]
RANAHVTYPARFQLIAAMNPCRCGYLGDPAQACSKAPRCAEEYQGRISGPLFDRIDIHLDVPAVSPLDLDLPPPAEGTAQVAARVAQARQIQADRYKDFRGQGIRTNAQADGELLDKVARPDDAGRKLLVEAAARLGLTARGYHRVLRVARTLADMDQTGGVTRLHVAEALSFRRLAPGRGPTIAKL